MACHEDLARMFPADRFEELELNLEPRPELELCPPRQVPWTTFAAVSM